MRLPDGRWVELELQPLVERLHLDAAIAFVELADPRSPVATVNGDLHIVECGAEASVEVQAHIVLVEICVSLTQHGACDDVVLNETAQWLARSRDQVLLVRPGNGQSLHAANGVLGCVQIHLIAVEVRIVGVTIHIMQPDGLLLSQHPRSVRHDAGLMQRRLTVHEQRVAGLQVPEDRHRGLAALDVCDQLLGDGLATLEVQFVQVLDALAAVGLRNVHFSGAWVLRTSLHQLSEILGVVRGGDLRILEAFGDGLWDTDLGGLDVQVWRDDGARREVHALAHHLHAEDALLLLELLPDAGNRGLRVLLALAAVEVVVHGQLQVLDVLLQVAHHTLLASGVSGGTRTLAFYLLDRLDLLTLLPLGRLGRREDVADLRVLPNDVQQVRGLPAQRRWSALLRLTGGPEAVRRHGDGLQKVHIGPQRPCAWNEPPKHLFLILEDLPQHRSHVAGLHERLRSVPRPLHEELRVALLSPLGRLHLANRAGIWHLPEVGLDLGARDLHSRGRRVVEVCRYLPGLLVRTPGILGSGPLTPVRHLAPHVGVLPNPSGWCALDPHADRLVGIVRQRVRLDDHPLGCVISNAIRRQRPFLAGQDFRSLLGGCKLAGHQQSQRPNQLRRFRRVLF
mmetsp:Transcript_149658/g.480491  ORF Transcript_149658/g.480491 Transcript_149658/m.480491 type:complete len:623 (+) Transcript_149658:3713-5581(+)